MATPQAKDIKDIGSFRLWLRARPADKFGETALAIASRLALRTLVTVDKDFATTPNRPAHFLAANLHATIVASVAARRNNSELSRISVDAGNSTNPGLRGVDAPGESGLPAAYFAAHLVRHSFQHAAALKTTETVRSKANDAKAERDAADDAYQRAVNELNRVERSSPFEDRDSVLEGKIYHLNHDVKSTGQSQMSAHASEKSLRDAVDRLGEDEDEILLYSGYAVDCATSRLDIASVWQSLRDDAAWIEKSNDPVALAHRPLWNGTAPLWWRNGRAQLETDLTASSSAKSARLALLDWYDSVVAGQSAFNLPDEIAEKLELRMSLGDNRPNFWNRRVHEIEAEICSWLNAERAKLEQLHSSPPVFISYNQSDVEVAKIIGGVIEENSYSAFAQYKNMPPGSDFVSEMQSGLSVMGKFTPLYSPEYMDSDQCQAEWNAAYNMDPVGKRRLIIGFLVRKTILKPLMRQRVYVPLYGLSNSDARKAIINAFQDAATKKTISEDRKEAFEQSIPIAAANELNQLTFIHSPEIERPFIDDEFTTLPSSMRKVLSPLIKSLSQKNAPSIVLSHLQLYLDELDINGLKAHVADLRSSMDIIQAEIEHSASEPWYSGGIKSSLQQLISLHERFRQNFPRVMLRDFAITQSPVNPTSFDEHDFRVQNAEIAKAVSQLADDQMVTPEFQRVMAYRERQRKDIESLGRHVPETSDKFINVPDEKSLDDIKRTFLWNHGGTMERVLQVATNILSIADSPAGQKLTSVIPRLLNIIWKG